VGEGEQRGWGEEGIEGKKQNKTGSVHTYSVTLRHIRATIVALEKQQALHIVSVCV